jgi:hypothetical protein
MVAVRIEVEGDESVEAANEWRECSVSSSRRKMMAAFQIEKVNRQRLCGFPFMGKARNYPLYYSMRPRTSPTSRI